MVSLLGGQAGVKTLDLPKPRQATTRVPLRSSAFRWRPASTWSRSLRKNSAGSLLDDRHGASRTMYVRTSALVTNLGVHFKLGRENSLAWVTTLDKGAAGGGRHGACVGLQRRRSGQGRDQRAGHRQLRRAFRQTRRAARASDYRNAYFVSARSTVAGVEDLAFYLERLAQGHRTLALQRADQPRAPLPDERSPHDF
jgi:hypothetical protein